MKKEEQNEEEMIEDAAETPEVNAEKPKTASIFQPKAPLFPNANRFGKGAQANNFNTRQRPGRAASRGR